MATCQKWVTEGKVSGPTHLDGRSRCVACWKGGGSAYRWIMVEWEWRWAPSHMFCLLFIEIERENQERGTL